MPRFSSIDRCAIIGKESGFIEEGRERQEEDECQECDGGTWIEEDERKSW